MSAFVTAPLPLTPISARFAQRSHDLTDVIDAHNVFEDIGLFQQVIIIMTGLYIYIYFLEVWNAERGYINLRYC